MVEGNWVFGMIERRWDPIKQKWYAGKAICIVVEKRNEATLKSAILKHIRHGSIIHSDLWKAYGNIVYYTVDGIEPYYKDHLTVNHEENYKDPITGCHTNTIEGHWRVSKASIPKRIYADAELLQGYLFRQIWGDIFKGDIWNGLLYTLQGIRYNPAARMLKLYGKKNEVTGQIDFIGWKWEGEEFVHRLIDEPPTPSPKRKRPKKQRKATQSPDAVNEEDVLMDRAQEERAEKACNYCMQSPQFHLKQHQLQCFL